RRVLFRSVYLFDDSQRVAAVITNPAGTSGFGNALAALGPNRLLIANPNDSDAGDNAGSVFIYDLIGNQLRKIHNPSGKHDDFGSALAAVDEHRFLIGAPNASQTYISGGQLFTNITAGAVYLYEDSGRRLLTFTNPYVSDSAAFGVAFAMLGPGRVLIGSPNDKAGVNPVGRVLLYNLDGLHLETIDNP